MIVFRTFAALTLLIAAAGCTDPVERLCRADITERLIYPDSLESYEFSGVSYDDRINEMVEASLNAPPAIPAELRAAYRADLQRRARRASVAWGELKMSFHRYTIKARGRSGGDVTSTLTCVANPTLCRCGSRLARAELYRS